MELIAELFDRMDRWRHLPNYQLERRADLFFSLYLPVALKAKLGIEIHPLMVPEFPVRIGTIYPNIETDKSFKIDYVCFSRNRKRVVFVELKTEGMSRRVEQEKYLLAAQGVGLEKLLDGLLKIFRATQAKRKYFLLLDLLGQIGYLHIPEAMYQIASQDSLAGINKESEEIEIDCDASRPEIIYLQPNGDGDEVLSFAEFRRTVETFDDPISQRFAASLSEWANVKAGERVWDEEKR